jgi:signal transduction histidine kinase
MRDFMIRFLMVTLTAAVLGGTVHAGEAGEVEAFVKRGAGLISQKGEKAFDAFRKKGGEWYQGDRYVYVWDLNGLRYVYPPYPEGEGEQMRGLKDVDGKPIGELFIRAASSPEGEGWVHYRWPKPGEREPSWKSTYIMKAVAPSGKAFLIGSGAYEMPVDRKFVVDAVDAAVELIEKQGAEAFKTLRDKRSQFIYQDTYVFVVAENGVELLNVAFPKLEGRSVLHYRDADGNYFVKEFIRVARTKGSGWVDYPWPKPGDVERSHKSTYVRKAVIEGKLVAVCAGMYLD